MNDKNQTNGNPVDQELVVDTFRSDEVLVGEQYFKNEEEFKKALEEIAKQRDAEHTSGEGDENKVEVRDHN